MNKKLLLVFFTAVVLRLVIMFTAFHGDLNNNISWGTLAIERGLDGFYEGESWPNSAPNQPPLTILTFTSARFIWNSTYKVLWDVNKSIRWFPSGTIWFWEDKGMTLLVKLPGILADLGIGWLIYHYFRRKKKGKLGFRLATVWLFNPITWYNSAIWGQTDSVVNLLGLAAVIFLLRKNLVWFATLITLSVLFKGSLLLFIPIIFFVAIMQKHSLSDWIKATITSTAAVVFTTIWFHPKLDLFVWLFSLYKDRILPGEIGFLTANAFNFWWLVDPGKVLDATRYLGLSARVWGFAIILPVIGGAIYWMRKKLNDKRLLVSLLLVTLVSFLFMTRIHERYLYPLFPYATILLGLVPALAIPYVTLSMAHLLNLYHLFWAPSVPLLESLYLSPIFAQVISIVNIMVLIYLLRLFRRAKI